jgi:hypothetical protein
MTLRYNDESCNKFVAECEAAGFEVEHYKGRFWWEGPAVRVKGDKEYLKVVRATTVNIQNDDMGKGMIIYPVKRGKLLEDV